MPDWARLRRAEVQSDRLSTALAEVGTSSRGVTSDQLVEDIENRLGVEHPAGIPATVARPVENLVID